MTSPSEPSANPAPASLEDPNNYSEHPLPPTDSSKEPPGFGWTAYAERLNGRFAMVGFIALLLLELWTRQDFFTWLGLP